MKAAALPLAALLALLPCLLPAAEVEVKPPTTPNPDGPSQIQVIITPDATQTSELETLHSLTLTDSQLTEIRKAVPQMPKRIARITNLPREDAKSHLTAVLDPRGRVIVSTTPDGVPCMAYASALNDHPQITLCLDRQGRFYFDGVLIPYDQLLAATQNSAPCKPKKPKAIEILLPPAMTGAEPILHDHVRELYAVFIAHGWTDASLPDNLAPPAAATKP